MEGAAEVVDELAVEARDGDVAAEGEIQCLVDGDFFCGVGQGGMLQRGAERRA